MNATLCGSVFLLVSVASPSESSFLLLSGLWGIETYFQEEKVFQSEMKVKIANVIDNLSPNKFI